MFPVRKMIAEISRECDTDLSDNRAAYERGGDDQHVEQHERRAGLAAAAEAERVEHQQELHLEQAEDRDADRVQRRVDLEVRGAQAVLAAQPEVAGVLAAGEGEDPALDHELARHRCRLRQHQQYEDRLRHRMVQPVLDAVAAPALTLAARRRLLLVRLLPPAQARLVRRPRRLLHELGRALRIRGQPPAQSLGGEEGRAPDWFLIFYGFILI